jgi:hypothetical protein
MMITIDFAKQDSTLFSGRKNGERAKNTLIVNDSKKDQKVRFFSKEGQLITSSFFLGLLDDYIRHFSSVNELMNNLDMNGLDPISREECLRAIKRGAAKNQALF